MDQENRDAGAGTGKAPAEIVITMEDLGKKPPSAPAAQPRATAMEAAAPSSKQALAAGFWLRLLAKVLDVAFVLLAFCAAGAIYVVTATLANSRRLPLADDVRQWLEPALLWWAAVACIAFYAVYTIASHAAAGRSFGKCICGIRVIVPADVSRRGWYFFARFLLASMGLSLLGIGHLEAAFRKDKRALHDLIVGSRVVKWPVGDVKWE